MRQSHNKGFFLIEVIVAASIISVVLILLLGSIQDSVEVSQRSLERTQASYLLEEGAETVKAIRDNGWQTSILPIVTGTTYYLSWGGSSWSLTQTPINIDNFTRTVLFSDVYRDSNEDISSAGTLDPNTKQVTITVTWVVPTGPKSETLIFYMSNIR